MKTMEQIPALFSEGDLKRKISEIGRQISLDYKYSHNFTVICVLKGALLFTADLIRSIDVPLKVEFVRVESYGSSTKSSGTIKPVDLTLPNLRDSDVLVVEDIVDSGLTSNFFLDYLKNQHGVRSVKLAVVLDKDVRREHIVQIDYACFKLSEDKFVVGYGLDYDGYLRNLPYIGYMTEDHLKTINHEP